MNVFALLSFFDEEPALLERCVSEVVSCGVDRVLAFDGPYALYPYDKLTSTPDCYASIHEAAKAGGAKAMVFPAVRPYKDNEVGKRQHMFDVAHTLADEDDWLLVVDSDHFWESDSSLHELLAETEYSFARVSFSEVTSPGGESIWEPLRPLMRARRDLRMGTNHYTYVTDDGVSRILERPQLGPELPALDLTDHVRVLHGVRDRDEARRARQVVWYEKRESLGLEP